MVDKLQMEKHPEGGYYKETYRARGKFSTPSGERNYSTAIYYLLPAGSKSNLHRIKSDEIWHFYLGDPMTLAQIYKDGNLKLHTLGSNLEKGEKLQHMVPGDCWFGGFPNKDSEYSLVGCTVSPGFDFADFELGQKEKLLKEYPQHKKLIEKLT
ncbi:MAG: cupin domain-containing protein [Halobacteriovoraceae bacterium]|nr:cupin domain-containing protein [Halobacteriovoraceae bacterium]